MDVHPSGHQGPLIPCVLSLPTLFLTVISPTPVRFEDLRLLLPEVRDNVRAMGFNRPTDIQFKVIPHVLEGDDILAIAQTGTGKRLTGSLQIS